MYILNINKSYGTNTPQILGRVADLPYMDFEFMFKDGTKPVDLTGCTVEFRGLTSTDNKIISTESVTPKDSKNGTINFKVPKNFYSAPGAFKRAYFAIKKNSRIDTTQDIIIHVLDSVDMDAEDAQDVIDVVDKIIASVEKQVKDETNRLIQQIKNDTASTIADSNKKLSELDKQINDFKTNTNSTINQLNSNIDKTNSKYTELNNRVINIQKLIDESELMTMSSFENLLISSRNLIKQGAWYPGKDGVMNVKDDFGEEVTIFYNEGSSWPRLYNSSVRDIEWVNGEKYILNFLLRANSANYDSISMQIANADSSQRIVSTGSLDVTTNYKLFSFPFIYKGQTTSDISLQLFVYDGQSSPQKRSLFLKNTTIARADKVVMGVPALEDIASRKDVINLQKQIDDLKKIITALGGS